jgi:hypothetical protein
VPRCIVTQATVCADISDIASFLTVASAHGAVNADLIRLTRTTSSLTIVGARGFLHANVMGLSTISSFLTIVAAHGFVGDHDSA